MTAVATEPAAVSVASRTGLTAADVMSAPVLAVPRQASLWTAWSLIQRTGFRHVVVVEGSRCIGVVDDRHIALRWPLGLLGKHRPVVGDVVPGLPHYVLPATPVREVARIMLADQVDAVPVVSYRGDIVGLVTSADLVAFLAKPDGDPPDGTQAQAP